jgi:hypothetical protein|tara:strand:+ start:188 stop:508 length:321 start_codon:yes stop_codon:yes gene_type:complete
MVSWDGRWLSIETRPRLDQQSKDNTLGGSRLDVRRGGFDARDDAARDSEAGSREFWRGGASGAPRAVRRSRVPRAPAFFLGVLVSLDAKGETAWNDHSKRCSSLMS